MYSTDVYYYIPRQDVVVYFGSSPRSYQTVYAKPLRLHKGVDNRIQFRFINQDQKPVDVTGKELTIRIMDHTGVAVMVKKALTPVLPVTGITEFQLHASELENIIAQKAFYSIEIPVDAFDLPVFVDSSSGARGMIEIVDSVLPKHIPSETVTIPTHPNPNGNTVTFYSSVVDTGFNSNLTIQTYFDDFSGNVQVQGSTVPDTGWYDIDTAYTYTDQINPSCYIVQGFHPFIRLKVQCTAGNIPNILIR